MGNSAKTHLIRLLQADVESARAETEAMRSSIRYRLGDVLLQALPLSFRSFRVIPRLLALLLTHRRNVRSTRSAAVTAEHLPAGAFQCSDVVFKPTLSQWLIVGNNSWETNNEAALLARLDAGPVKRLTLYAITEPIARRLARLQWQGCVVVLHVSDKNSQAPLLRYAQALCMNSNNGLV